MSGTSYRWGATSIGCVFCEHCVRVGDVAYMAGELPSFSVVDSLENAVKASGKLGGVAGVLAGTHI